MASLKDRVYSAWKNGTSPSPATKTLGIRILNLQEGRAFLEMNVSENMHNLSGTMHGGIMGDLADAAMGIALATTLGPGEDFTTIEFQISFIRPHVTGPLRAEGVLTRRGRRVSFTEASLTNEENKLVSRATGTCLILRGQA